VVVEVVSASNEGDEWARKLREYRSLGPLRHLLLIDTTRPLVRVCTRGADGRWGRELLVGLAGEVRLADLGLTLPVRDLYDASEVPGT
jgi:Uma2 family endonuclease